MQRINNQYKALLLLFIAFIFGQLIAVVLFTFINPIVLRDYSYLNMILPFTTYCCLLGSQIYYNKQIKRVKSNLRSIRNTKDILDQQEENYSTTEIINWFSEFKSLKIIQMYMVAGTNCTILILGFFANMTASILCFYFGLIYFIMINPFLVDFYKDLNLTENEKKLFENHLKNK